MQHHTLFTGMKYKLILVLLVKNKFLKVIIMPFCVQQSAAVTLWTKVECVVKNIIHKPFFSALQWLRVNQHDYPLSSSNTKQKSTSFFIMSTEPSNEACWWNYLHISFKACRWKYLHIFCWSLQMKISAHFLLKPADENICTFSLASLPP